ncbi:TPA: hypothetical protein DEP94_03300 [Candidatus Nomurabacteria bacterium]|nr:hypothetical protein [Candidatus Nomurabacteria bacterium]
MKKINNKIIIAGISLFIVISIIGAIKVFAATTPFFGVTSSYTILSSTYTNTVPGTTVTGDIGFTTPPAVNPAGIHPNYGSGAPYSTAGTDQGNLLTSLNSQPCTFTFPDTAIDLATDTSHGTIGVYSPGVYCTQATRAASIGTAGITLSGAGTYIFRVNGALTTVMNSVVTLSGASACDVFWTPTEAATLGANSTFKGNNIDASGITLGTNVNWVGRALSFGGTVTTAVDDVLTLPTSCTLPPPPPNVDMGGIYSMPWVTPRIDVTKVATPVSLPIGGGSVVYDYVISNPGSIPLSNVTLVDDKCSNITLLSGDINSNSKLEITESWKYSCAMNLSQTTTNIAIASGTADFTTVTDTANATVVVAVPVITVIPTPTVLIVSTTTAVVPLFPDAGLDPDPNFFPWNFLALLSVIFVSVLNLTKNKTTKPF